MLAQKTPDFSAADTAVLKNYKGELDHSIKFIPTWVKVAVAVALGLGTMVGWKRIVVTVGERIGKTHLNYGQGASAELVAMLTIGAADVYGPSCQYDSRPVLGGGRNDGRQRLGTSMAHGTQPGARVDPDAAGVDRAGGRIVLGVQGAFLIPLIDCKPS